MSSWLKFGRLNFISIIKQTCIHQLPTCGWVDINQRQKHKPGRSSSLLTRSRAELFLPLLLVSRLHTLRNLRCKYMSQSPYVAEKNWQRQRGIQSTEAKVRTSSQHSCNLVTHFSPPPPSLISFRHFRPVFPEPQHGGHAEQSSFG